MLNQHIAFRKNLFRFFFSDVNVQEDIIYSYTLIHPAKDKGMFLLSITVIIAEKNTRHCTRGVVIPTQCLQIIHELEPSKLSNSLLIFQPIEVIAILSSETFSAFLLVGTMKYL